MKKRTKNLAAIVCLSFVMMIGFQNFSLDNAFDPADVPLDGHDRLDAHQRAFPAQASSLDWVIAMSLLSKIPGLVRLITGKSLEHLAADEIARQGGKLISKRNAKRAAKKKGETP